ncbi:hypothetical protein, partial [Phascolarctobacterium succinatutens]
MLSAAKALPANSKLPRFAETTLRTPPMIVRYVKPKFLHEVIPAENGFKKSISRCSNSGRKRLRQQSEYNHPPPCTKKRLGQNPTLNRKTSGVL